jgi:hypothetical protein
MWKPLADNGKPIVKWGRKATGQKILIAGLPKAQIKGKRLRRLFSGKLA